MAYGAQLVLGLHPGIPAALLALGERSEDDHQRKAPGPFRPRGLYFSALTHRRRAVHTPNYICIVHHNVSS